MLPPTESTRGREPESKGPGKWFYTVVLLIAVLGVGGFLLVQNYDRLVGQRNATATPNANPLLPAQPSDARADAAANDTADASGTDPVAGLDDTEPADDPERQLRTGPDPFASGPPVLGGDAIQGLFRDSGDTGPLDPAQRPADDGINGADPLRDPSLSIANPADQDDAASPTPDNQPDAQATPVPPVAAQKPQPARIVFLVDASGSLVDSLPQMLAWLDEALRTVEEGEQFAVYFFKADKPIPIQPQGMIAPTNARLETISKDWLSPDALPVFPSGRSNPEQAIRQAIALNPTDIYLLSDDAFAFHQGDTTSRQALDLVEQAIGETQGVRVHGVQFFYRSDQSILETLANQYDGTFEFVRENVIPNADPIDLLEELGSE